MTESAVATPIDETTENEQNQGQTLRDCVRSTMDAYLKQLDGHAPGQVYQMFLAEVEAPLLEVIMKHVRGNQSKAAELLGINRGTLRKKLKMYDLHQ
jgi:Fis family transcriptional regulator